MLGITVVGTRGAISSSAELRAVEPELLDPVNPAGSLVAGTYVGVMLTTFDEVLEGFHDVMLAPDSEPSEGLELETDLVDELEDPSVPPANPLE